MKLDSALRLYPVVPGNARTAEVDTILPLGGGEDGKSPIFIPKGQIVQYSIYAMHRRKDLYGEDAEEFKPERWETYRPGWVSCTGSSTMVPAFADHVQEYLPFNGGPRICLGRMPALLNYPWKSVIG